MVAAKIGRDLTQATVAFAKGDYSEVVERIVPIRLDYQVRGQV